MPENIYSKSNNSSDLPDGKNIMITLLGGATTEYRSADYTFPDESKVKSFYFGLALAEYLTTTDNKVDKLVIIGTNGSFWDNLVRLVVEDLQAPELEDLSNKAQNHKITKPDLEMWQDRLENALSKKYGIMEVELIVNDYAITPEQQLGLIRLLHTISAEAKHITFDVTHAFRHLSILSLISAVVAHRLRKTPIEIYYGALDLTRSMGYTPVLKLDGLIQIFDWLAALNSYDNDGDYGAFASEIGKLPGGEKAAENLKDAAFNEYIGNFHGAQLNIEAFRENMKKLPDDNPIVVFSDELNTRMSWIDNQDYYERQRDQAKAALKKEDFLRAAILGTEALITRVAMKVNETSPHSPRDRSAITGDWDKYLKAANIPHRQEVDVLKGIRNRVAHGFQGRQTSEVRDAFITRESCRKELERCFKLLLP